MDKKPSLIFYCGITMIKPIQEISKIIEEQYNCNIDVVSGDSEWLYEKLKEEQKGDLYLPGSSFFRKKYLSEGLLLKEKYIGFNRAAIFVQKGNPKKISDLTSLLDDNISAILCNPTSGSIGEETKKVLKRFGKKRFFKEAFDKTLKTGNNSKDINSALIDKSVDIAINWRATRYWDENHHFIEDIEIDEKYAPKQRMVINLLKFSKNKKIAKALMRYAVSADGQAILKKYGFYAKLSTELKIKKASVKTILDAQSTIIVITDGDRIVDANKSLLDFFDNFSTLEKFKKEHQCICDFFEIDIPNDDYVIKKDYGGLNWAEYIINNPKRNFRVIMKKNSKLHHFSISAKKEVLNSFTKEVFIVTTLNDITKEIQTQQKLKYLNENLENIVNNKTPIYDVLQILSVTKGQK